MFDDKGGDNTGIFDDGDKGMGAFDDDGRGEEAGIFDDGRTEGIGLFDERGGKETGMFDDGGESGVPDDGRGKEAGAFDDGGEAGLFDDGRAEEAGAFDERGKAGLFDEGVNEVGAWGWEDGTELGSKSDDAGGAEPSEGVVDDCGMMHWPRESTPKEHVAVGGEEVEGDGRGWDD